jgi:hypothetical protein
VAENFKRGDCENAFFKIDGEAIGGQGFKKKLPNEEGEFAYPENPHESCPCMQTPLLDRQRCGPSCVENFVKH